MFSSFALSRRLGLALASACLALAFTSPAAAAQCKIGVFADLPVTMDGLRASVPVKINGRDTRFWLDSGAFFSIMSDAKATELGLKVEPAPEGFYIVGIGGAASAGITTVRSFGIVGTTIPNIEFLVGGSDAGNGLIGRNLLGIADTEFDLAHGSVKLLKASGCDGPLAYWAGTNPYFAVPLHEGMSFHDRMFKLPVSINGVQFEAEIDTGAPTSLISRHAAERARIDLAGPAVVPEERIGGIGRHFKGGWVVPVASVAVGDEQILNTHLTVIDGNIDAGEGAPDMLLGADFVLAHRIYVSHGQQRIYFTYSGGKPFVTWTSPKPGSQPAAAVPLPPGTQRVEAVGGSGEGPKSADEFARRGNARIAQHAFDGGIADLTRAIALAPKNAAYFRDRAKAYDQNDQPTLARADLSRALEIDPNDAEALQARGFIELRDGDRDHALADAEAAARLVAPTSLDAQSLAYLFTSLHQPTRAVGLYDGVIAAHRDDSELGELLNGRCWVRALGNLELDKAEQDCNRAIKRDGLQADYLDSRALVEFRQGRYTAAVSDYDAALKLKPKMAWSLYMRGVAKIAAGNAAAGAADKAAALAIDADVGKDVADFGLGAGSDLARSG